MKVFRSVLELAPGNAEALGELEELERAVASLTATPRLDVPASQAAVAAVPESFSAVADPASGTRSSISPAVVAAAAVLLLAVIAGASAWLNRGAAPAVPQTAAAIPQPATPSAPAPAAQPAPAPLPAPPTVNPDAVAQPSATQAAPSAAPPRVTRGSADSRREPESAVPAPTAPPLTPLAPEPSPPAAAPPEPVAATPPPAPEPPVATAEVRHYHGRSLRRGFSRGYCDGTLQLLPDGLYFRTTSSSDGRRDDKRLTFGEIEDVEIEDDRLFIEGEDQNWEFGGTRDLLQRIRQHIRSNKKGDPIRF